MKSFQLIITTGMLLVILAAVPGQTAAGKDAAGPKRGRNKLEFINPEGVVVAAISIEIADRPETRARGLMWRNELKCSQGMLFIFEQTERLSFWMRNTPIPLDIFFLDARGSIYHIVHQAAPMSDRIYSPLRPGRYVVETCAGFARRNEISPGWQVEWPGKE